MTEIVAQDATVRTGLAGVAATSRVQSHGFMRLTEGRPEWVVNAAIIVIISTLVSLFLGTAGLIHGGGDYGELVNKLISGWVWVPLVPLILAIDRRLPLSESQFPLRLAVHFGLSLPGAALHTAILALADFPFKIVWFSPIRAPQNTYYFLFADWFSYWAIFALIFALQYYKRYSSSQLEIERLKNRYLQLHLDNLRMQLEPHFLSNALNAISSTTESNPSLARRIIADLGVLLRLSHEYRDRHLIPLKEEMVILEHYLAIQRVRFGERIRIEIDVAPEAEQVLVPCLLLQPLVENSIRHGIMGEDIGGTISITASCSGGEVQIQLTDDGGGLPPDWRLERSSGQGLSITRARLDALYRNGSARFAIGTRPCGGTQVRIDIPILSGPAKQ